jgi:16S rRNA (uracil1498-N3)-methyltransferase
VHRFHVPAFVIDSDVTLLDDEAHHLSRVLRLRPGDRVAIFDGHGREAFARVESDTSSGVVVRPIEMREAAPEPSVALTLAQAVLKSDKMDDVIRDAVMLGAAAIQPFTTRRTEVTRSALGKGRRERWNRTVISSVKQCGRAVIPPVLEPVDFSDLLVSTSGRTRLMFVEPSAVGGEGKTLRSLEDKVSTNAMVLIGPEGGWDPVELEAAASAGVILVGFGGLTLRADAAGSAALVLLQYIWGER